MGPGETSSWRVGCGLEPCSIGSTSNTHFHLRGPPDNFLAVVVNISMLLLVLLCLLLGIPTRPMQVTSCMASEGPAVRARGSMIGM